ncbi:hypothetical protein BpHYR1_047819, partial [Brachionus plicatilis]
MKLVIFYLMVYFYNSINKVGSDELTLSDYSLEWIEMEEEMEFKLNTIVEDSDNIWTSFALSFDDQMGNDNALICKMYGTDRKVDHAYNRKTQNNGVINYHLNRISSSSPLSLNSNSDKDQSTFVSIETTTKVDANTNLPTIQTFTTEINKFGEFSIGDFSLQWKNNDDKTNFTFVTKNIGKQSLFYSAFAFSKDSFMGQDDVIACKVTSDSQYLIERYYNQGKSQPKYLTAESKDIGISGPEVNLSDGTLTCSLMLEK